jgi:hypothetical protein
LLTNVHKILLAVKLFCNNFTGSVTPNYDTI